MESKSGSVVGAAVGGSDVGVDASCLAATFLELAAPTTLYAACAGRWNLCLVAVFLEFVDPARLTFCVLQRTLCMSFVNIKPHTYMTKSPPINYNTTIASSHYHSLQFNKEPP